MSILCAICKQKVDSPIQMPCMNRAPAPSAAADADQQPASSSICQWHIKLAHVHLDQFSHRRVLEQCPMCTKRHFEPYGGFTSNKNVLLLLHREESESQRRARLLLEEIQIMRQEITERDCAKFIKRYCEQYYRIDKELVNEFEEQCRKRVQSHFYVESIPLPHIDFEFWRQQLLSKHAVHDKYWQAMCDDFLADLKTNLSERLNDWHQWILGYKKIIIVDGTLNIVSHFNGKLNCNSFRSLFDSSYDLSHKEIIYVERETFDNSNNIDKDSLLLADNKIEKLHQEAFVGLGRHLTRLDLSGNKLTKLIELNGLNHLLELNLDRNEITSVHMTLALNSLQKLSLSNNRLKSISFKTATSLRELDLNGNLISTIENYDGIFPIYLEQLSLNDNRLKNHVQLSSPNARLKSIKLECNQIESFECKNMKHLTVLNLSENKLNSIECHNLPQLKELVLRQNCLSMVASKMLKKLPSLEKINLNVNSIAKIEPGSFGQNCPKLREIQMKHNMLTKLSSDCFLCESLQYLSLNDNRIAFVGKENAPFEHCKCLKELHMDRNKIGNEFNSSCFRGLEKTLEKLSLCDNLISKLIKSNNTLSIKIFLLDFNQLEEFDANFFTNFTHLQELSLKGNRIKRFTNNNSANSNSELTTLCLNDNKLTSLETRDLTPMPMLKCLYVEFNQLQRVTLSGHECLEELHLKFNKLTQVPTLSSLNRLQVLDLNNNCIDITQTPPDFGSSLKLLNLTFNNFFQAIRI